MPPAVLRRYTPPTCTLEVRANGSALSRWTDQTVMKNVRFNLRFDDPRRPTEQRIEVQGDRHQLEALHATVSDYVAQLLGTDAGLDDEALLRLTPERSPLVAAVAQPSVESETASRSIEIVNSDGVDLRVGAEGIRLKPLGLLAHELHLGTLAAGAEVDTVRLSTTQLVDLAEALDAYTAEALAVDLPSLAGTRRSPEWLRIAAVAVLAVGVTGSIAKFVMDVNAPPSPTVATENAQPSELNTSQPSPDTYNTTLPDATAQVPNPAALPSPPPIPTVPPGNTLPLPTPPAGTAPGQLPQQATVPPPAPQAAPVRPPAVPTAPPQVIPQPPAQRPAAAPAPVLIPEDPAATARTGNSPNPAAMGLPGENSEAASGTFAADSAQPETTMRSALARTAAGSIPQVGEAQQYFQSRWQPPENLNRALEYRVIVAANGVVQQVVPLGEAAGIYVDRSGMPLMGEPLVSPLPTGRSATLRVVLYPDGRVQTLLEGVTE
ncbi:MAG: hypothetical protein OHK0037_28300 [Elainellaceae cyanobacterium]